jgi:hypothetical protein
MIKKSAIKIIVLGLGCANPPLGLNFISAIYFHQKTFLGVPQV